MGFGVGALAIDVGYIYQTKTEMQQAIDIASLVALKKLEESNYSPIELYFENPTTAAAEFTKTIIDTVNSNAPAVGKGISVTKEDIQFGKWNFSTKQFDASTTTYPVNSVKITATLSKERGNAVPTFLGRMIRDSFDIKVDTTAIFPIPPSVHILSEDAVGSMQILKKHSDADFFTLQVNSNAKGAYKNENGVGIPNIFNANVTGTFVGRGHKKIKEEQPRVADFLKDMPEPEFGNHCDYRNYETSKINRTLKPGIYCGGLTIKNVKKVKFSPGRYMIKDGPLIIDKSMKGKDIFGKNVLFYFYGKKAQIIADGGQLSLSGRKKGIHAGVPIISARKPNAPVMHQFNPDSKIYVHGIFYAPDTGIEINDAQLLGSCRLVCLTSKTLLIDDTFANYNFGQKIPSFNPLFDVSKKPPPTPPSLIKKCDLT